LADTKRLIGFTQPDQTSIAGQAACIERRAQRQASNQLKLRPAGGRMRVGWTVRLRCTHKLPNRAASRLFPRRLDHVKAGGWVDLGGRPPRPPGRSGRAQFGHPAPQITASLRDGASNGRGPAAAADTPADTPQTVPTSSADDQIAD